MKGICFVHVLYIKLCFDHVANAEIYRWGVENAAGLAVKYLTKLAASTMFRTRSEPPLSCYFFES
jgi:hypothetical protein